MLEFITKILDYLIANYAAYMVITMSLIVSLTITMLHFIKIPIKKLTSKLPNEKLRKLANKMFIILAFAISAVVWVALKTISPKYFPCDAIEILLTGAFSIVIYAFGDGIITKSAAGELVDKITEIDKTDEKAKENVSDAVTDFWNKMK